MNKVNIIGLTGPTGSGKTEASKVFAQCGFKVINADTVARTVLDCNAECKQRLISTYGNNIIDDVGQIKRDVLAKFAFRNRETENLLNSITHPYIVKEIEKNILNLKRENCLWILLDAPLLFESKLDVLCDKTVSVLASKIKRLERIMIRDTIDMDAAVNRINIQPNEDFYVKRSNYILYNNCDKNNFNIEIEKIILKIKGEGI